MDEAASEAVTQYYDQEIGPLSKEVEQLVLSSGHKGPITNTLVALAAGHRAIAYMKASILGDKRSRDEIEEEDDDAPVAAPPSP